jgi:hypothetical protein
MNFLHHSITSLLKKVQKPKFKVQQFCRAFGALIFLNIVLQEFFFLKTPRGDVSTGMLQSQGCFFKILKFLAKAQSVAK